MLVIGIDPGTHLAGAMSSDGRLLGVWEIEGRDLGTRLSNLRYFVQQMVKAQYHVDAYAVEEPVGHFQGRGWLVATAYGVVVQALHELVACPIYPIINSEARAALSGNGTMTRDKSGVVQAAQLSRVEGARPEYWLARLNPHGVGTNARTGKPAFWGKAVEMAETASDAFGISLAGLNKLISERSK